MGSRATSGRLLGREGPLTDGPLPSDRDDRGPAASLRTVYYAILQTETHTLTSHQFASLQKKARPERANHRGSKKGGLARHRARSLNAREGTEIDRALISTEHPSRARARVTKGLIGTHQRSQSEPTRTWTACEMPHEGQRAFGDTTLGFFGPRI